MAEFPSNRPTTITYLTLPQEIRYYITKTVLEGLAPLERYPALTHVCRQLRAECFPILASLHVKCVCIPEVVSVFGETLEKVDRNIVDAFENAPFQKIQLSVTLTDEDPSMIEQLRTPLRLFARLAQQVSKWTNITIVIKEEGDIIEEERHFEEYIFLPLWYCRGFERVQVHGMVNQSYADSLVQKMLAKKPYANLDAIQALAEGYTQCLVQYANGWDASDDDISELWLSLDRLEELTVNEDAAKFMQERDHFLTCCRKVISRRRRENFAMLTSVAVHEADPPEWAESRVLAFGWETDETRDMSSLRKKAEFRQRKLSEFLTL
jgi:hypothetical protein